MIAKDIMLDENNELLFKNGDFDIQYSDGQHVKLILLSEQGAWRQEPLIGVGLRKMLNMKLGAADSMLLNKEISLQLQYDEYKVKNISIKDTNNISIEYERI